MGNETIPGVEDPWNQGREIGVCREGRPELQFIQRVAEGTPTTIDIPEDFLRSLDEDPAWRDAVRVRILLASCSRPTRILGEELMRLPSRFLAFAETQGESNQRIEAPVERIDDTLAELRRMNANAETRMNRMESDMGTVKGGHLRTRLREFLHDFAVVSPLLTLPPCPAS